MDDENEDVALEEMFEGYRDGYASPLSEIGEGTNRSDAYVFGWRNGRDDRTSNPRANADALRSIGMAIVDAARDA